MNITGLKYFPKPKMSDPVRYPKLIDPIESKMKNIFAIEMNKCIADVTKKMVLFLK